MKKPMLALGVAAAVSTSAVVAPAAFAEPADSAEQVAVQEDQSSSGEGSSGSTGDEGSSLSAGAIVGISLGVLAAVGIGGVVGVQQGWLELPEPLNAQVLGGLAAIASALSVPALAPKQEKKVAKGSCSPSAFDAVVPEWPAGFGTTVRFCDGKWAVAGAKGTDWILFFKNTNGKWARIQSDGTTRRGMTQACYNGIKLREQGAPEAFMREVPVCTPAEIGV